MGLTTPSSVSHDLVVEKDTEMLLACVGVGVGVLSAATAGYIKAGQPMDSRDVRLVLVLSPAEVTEAAATATAQRSPLRHRSVGESLRSSRVFPHHV
ncbi:hypothetical protein TSMEX_000362 [Taenia solium]|eukprot:TsM_000022800 transcript=TsM_000022800 gene=TsM_000022800